MGEPWVNSPVNGIDPFGEQLITPVRPVRRPSPTINPNPTRYPTINPNFPSNPSTPTKNPPGYFPYENNDPSVPFKFPVIEPPEVDPSDPFNTNDWYEKAKKLLEDIEEQNQRRQEDDNGGSHQGASCSIGDQDDYSPPEASHDNDGDGRSVDTDGQNGYDGEPDNDPPIENLDPSSLRSRQTPAEMSKNRVNKLRKQIRKNGFDPNEPVEVYDVDGKYIIKDGHHRTEAAIREGVREIPVRKYSVSSEQEKNQYLMEAAEAAGFRGY
jgi:hypothetical protein